MPASPAAQMNTDAVVPGGTGETVPFMQSVARLRRISKRVIPAKAGIQGGKRSFFQAVRVALDARVRGHDAG